MKVTPIHRETTRQGIYHEILHTGQHYDAELAANFEREFNLPKPIANLRVGSSRQAVQLADVIAGVDRQIEVTQPDFILVYGDTNSTAGAAIAAAKNNIPLVHVEAGLREFRKDVPEEINKLLIDSISDIHCCPTIAAVEQLKKEGKTDSILFSGDIVLDTITHAHEKINAVDSVLTRKLNNEKYYFATIHRAANTNNKQRLKSIVQAFLNLPHQVVFAVHPRTRNALQAFNLWDELQIDQIYTVGSRPFYETQWLISHAELTLTDSGGISKESFFHKTGCLLLDEQIEWQELVASGWINVCGTETKDILSAATTFVKPQVEEAIFGYGNAAELIINEIKKYYATR